MLTKAMMSWSSTGLALLLIPIAAKPCSALPPFHASSFSPHGHGPSRSGPTHQAGDSFGNGGQGNGTFDLSAHPWIPASQVAGSSRSPCPLLNTLANHGFLPRDGRNIGIDAFNDALVDALNFSPIFADELTTTNFNLLGIISDAQSYTTQTIDLETLNNYTTGNVHDASLTRLDHIQSSLLTPAGTPLGTLVLNQALLAQLLADSISQTYDFLNTSSLGRSRLRRDAASLAAGSPALSAAAETACLNEAGLVVQLIGEGGDPNEGDGDFAAETWDGRLARKDRVYEWFAFERFPMGWQRTRHQVTAETDMAPLAGRVAFWQEYWGKHDGNAGY